tara:strand:- start:2697 stop:2930 length:234 start_codon:yes stop_codon:yes gene_type:complete
MEGHIDTVVDNMCRGLYQGLDFDKPFSQLFIIALPIVFEDNIEQLRFLNFIERQNLFDFIQDKFMEKREGIINAYNE